ncbi:MAG TPA: hypothetical protein VFP61_10680 [Acidimicrobiales bacterium]|nr:hypothetical protein [Acidimicrobiales bacterium]
MPPAIAPAPTFPARVAFVGTGDAGTIVVDLLTDRGPVALTTLHRPGGVGWAEWTTMAVLALRRWAADGTEITCRVGGEGAARRCDLDDGVRRVRLDLAVSPRRAALPGPLTCAARTVDATPAPWPRRRLRGGARLR